MNLHPRSLYLFLSCLLFLPGLLAGEEESITPVAVVDAFHAALAAGDREQALAALAAGAVIFESGGAEMSRAEYESHHLAADLEFSKSTQREVLEQRSGSAGSYAWVLTRFAAAGSFHGREIHSQGVETMLLRLTSDGWRVTHVHWSSKSLLAGDQLLPTED